MPTRDSWTNDIVRRSVVDDDQSNEELGDWRIGIFNHPDGLASQNNFFCKKHRIDFG